MTSGFTSCPEISPASIIPVMVLLVCSTLTSGNAEPPYARYKWRLVPEGRGDQSGDNDLSRSSQSVKSLTIELERKSDKTMTTKI